MQFLFFKKIIFWIILFIHGLTPKSNSNSIPTLDSMSKLKLKSKFRFSFKFNFKLRFKFRFKLEFKLNSKFNFNSYSNSKSRFRMRLMGIVRVPNVHSNFNQFLLKIELKIAKFQFLIYFSIFNFQFLTDIA